MTNFELREDIVASEDGDTLSTSYGNHACRSHLGKCVLKHQTIVWDGKQMMKSCNYKKIGNCEAYITNTRVIIDSIQASRIFRNGKRKISESCNIESPRIMENNLLISTTRNHVQKKRPKRIKQKTVNLNL